MKPLPAKPWMPERAVRQLGRICRAGTRVLEYGSGGSTLWFAARGCRAVSIEHDPRWYVRVCRELLRRRCYETAVLHIPASSSGPEESCGADGKNYRDYARCGAKAAEGRLGRLDLVVVDGRARTECVRSVLALSSRPVVVVDDAERDRYQTLRGLLDRSRYTPRTLEERGRKVDFWTPR